MSGLAQKAAKKVLSNHVQQYQPQDPHYDEVIDSNGKKKKVKRGVPEGLSKRDEKALRKIRKRAHYLDKGMNLCGFRVGWTFWIGFIPVVGDVVDATLNYSLVVRPSKKLEISDTLYRQMLFNNAISAGVGMVPLVGDVALAVWKANSRNAHLLENFLAIRGQEFLAQQRRGPSTINQAHTTAQGVSHSDVVAEFGPGSGMEPAVGTKAVTKSSGKFGKK